MSAAVVRGLGLFVPLAALVAALRMRRPDERRVAALILATAWQVAFLPAVNLLAVRLGWWDFKAVGGTVAGIPVDLLLGWAVLWGALPALIADRLAVPLVVAALGWLDLALMPRLGPVVVLHRHWLYGESVAIGLCLVPALLLARWTARGERLPARAVGQVILSGTLMLALPTAGLGASLPTGPALSLLLQLLAVPALLGVAAVREFAVRGGGTPLPYDPPQRLVTSGPYAYVRNPMQVSMVLCLLMLAAFTGSPQLLGGAAVGFAYSAGLAAWHEGGQLRQRYGDRWSEYTSNVSTWLPRWRPWADGAPARIHVAQTCGMCSEVGLWILRHRPVGLEVCPAEEHPAGLTRITYESSDGRDRAQGVAALGRALHHFHLGWALLGWVLLLPGVAEFGQLVADAMGAGPRQLKPEPR